MQALSIPVFCAARIQRPTTSPGSSSPIKRRIKRALMPRFRNAKEPIQLTEAVRRILVRASSNNKPFGVFIIKGRLLMSNTETERFSSFMRRWPATLVGTYNANLTIDALLDDLREHFRDESSGN